MFDKQQLTYVAASPADGDQVAAYLRAGAVALTYTAVSAINALDVASLTFDGAGNAIGSVSGALKVYIDGTSGNDFEVTGNVADDAADSGNPLKIGYRAVNAALTAVSAANDRADAISDLYRRQITNHAPNIGLTFKVIELSDTALQLDDGTTHPLQAGRTKVIFQNLSNKPFYVGSDNTVTGSGGANPGIKIAGQATVTLDWGQFIPIYAIADTGQTPDCHLSQFA
jgi:hypothetical protein